MNALLASLVRTLVVFCALCGSVTCVVCAQQIKLVADDGAASAYFGYGVGVSGGTVIVGARGDDELGPYTGAAYLLDAASGAQTAKLLASDGFSMDNFGWAVAISGTTAIVGAYGDDELHIDAGAAYLFDATTGQETAKLLASDGAALDLFGTSVAISGTTAIVGAHFADVGGVRTGAAYLFDTTTGQETAKLVASDGAADDYFGYSVAISGTTAIVGAFLDDPAGVEVGSAYLFDTVTGQQITKLTAGDGAFQDGFGRSVGISGSVAIVGAYGDDDSGDFSGSAYLFDVTTGQQMAKLLPDDGEADARFGFASSISGDTAIVGAYFDDDNGFDSGAAYLFDVATGQQLVKLMASDGAASDYFGWAVAIDDQNALAGAYGDDDAGSNSGAAYLVGLGGSFAARDGLLGLNPSDFTCSAAPALGETWSTQVATTPSLGASTIRTFVALGAGGPTQGATVFGHELLILPPFLIVEGFGAHDLQVPPESALFGVRHSWQGGRLELGAGFFLILTNALDVVYGL